MRPITIEQTGVGTSKPYQVDRLQDQFKVGLGLIITGTATATVEHTFDSVDESDTGQIWFPHETLVAATESADGNYAYPIQAVRVNVTSGTGTATLKVLQG
jgi:hypothetical protein